MYTGYALKNPDKHAFLDCTEGMDEFWVGGFLRDVGDVVDFCTQKRREWMGFYLTVLLDNDDTVHQAG